MATTIPDACEHETRMDVDRAPETGRTAPPEDAMEVDGPANDQRVGDVMGGSPAETGDDVISISDGDSDDADQE